MTWVQAWDTRGRRKELTPSSCPPTSTCMSIHLIRNTHKILTWCPIVGTGVLVCLFWFAVNINTRMFSLDDHVRTDTGPRTTTEELRAAAQAVSRWCIHQALLLSCVCASIRPPLSVNVWASTNIQPLTVYCICGTLICQLACWMPLGGIYCFQDVF